MGSGSESTPTLMTARRSVSMSSSSRSWEMTSTAAPLAASVISAWWMAAAAPASTPQVGCETTSTPGFCSTSRPTTNFCRLPPDRLRASASMPGVRTSNSLTMRLAKSRALPARMKPPESRPWRWRPLSTPLSTRLISGTAAWPLRSSGTLHRPSARRREGPKPADGRAVDADRGVGRDGALAGQRQQQLVLAVAGDAGDAEDLAGTDLEADALEVDAVRLLRRAGRGRGRSGAARRPGRPRGGPGCGPRRRSSAAPCSWRSRPWGRRHPPPCRRAGWWRGRRAL